MSTQFSDLEDDTNELFNLDSSITADPTSDPTSQDPTSEDTTSAPTDTEDLTLNPQMVDATGAIENVGTDVTGVSIQKDTSSESVNLSGPDYSTSFCRPRETESAMGTTVSSWILKIARTFDIGGVSWYPHLIAVSSIGGVMFIVFLWYFIQNPDLIKPLMTGSLKLLWYGFIFFMILSVLILYIHFLYYIAYFFELTVHYFNLTCNPLLNERVSSLCCYFSDYVNWLIYYPSMIYFLICFAVLVVIDVFVLLPILAFFGFMVGFLFSLLGHRAENAPQVKDQISDVMNHPKVNGLLADGAKNIQGSVNKLKGIFHTSIPGLVPSAPPNTSAPSVTSAPSAPPVQSDVK